MSRWIPSHADIDGNERADQLAKLGTALDQINPTPTFQEQKEIIKNRMMNTKLKTPSTSAVGRGGLGRPVGVLPLALKPVIPVDCHNGTSIKSRRLKRTPSTGSITSVNSVRSGRSEVNSRSKQSARPKQEVEEVDGNTEQDVKFFNIETSTRPSSSSSNFSASSKNDSSTILWQDILERSQESDPYKVYEIVLHGESLNKIPDLEKFRKLRVLDVSGNKIKKMERLDFNKDLRDIKLYDNRLSVIEGLDNLKELSSLQLQHNNIEKIGTGLSSLKKLTNLRLDNNKLTKLDTPEIVSCSHIKILDVSNNDLESLSALNYLSNLEELAAVGNGLRTIGNLNKCKRLQELDLSHNDLSDLSGISNLPNLKILDMSHNRLDSFKSVGKLKSLEELTAASNRLTSLSPLVTISPKLQILNVCDNWIEQWDQICALSNLTELVELFASGNPFTLEDGEMPTYHLYASQELPTLEVIDGIQINRKTVKKSTAPVMRPMSAASVISVRHVDAQLDSVMKEHENILKNIGERFESLRTLFDTLPTEPPQSRKQTPTEGQSRCSSRARLREAQHFAATNFEDDYDNEEL